MPTLTNMIKQAGTIDATQAERLHLLIGDWHTLSDIAFADLLLYLPRRDGTFMMGAHCRPATSATLIHDDRVGQIADHDAEVRCNHVMKTGRRASSFDDTMAIEYVPINRRVTLEGEPISGSALARESLSQTRLETIAVLAVVQSIIPDRTPMHVQTNYTRITDMMLRMVAAAEFPSDEAPSSYRHGTPRVSDGLIHIDVEGRVLYASPNAVSNFHRLGVDEQLQDQVLAELVTAVVEQSDTVEESLAVVVMGRAAWMTEVEARGVIISLRALPLKRKGQRAGAIIMCRDVTELRRRERELMTKDAMIREINHRVKNNLQTVSALLRLQSRRASDPGAKQSLDDAQRRIYTIALVHEALSQTGAETVDFDATFSRLIKLAAGVATTGQHVQTRLSGSFGLVQAGEATTLAVVLNELIVNAVEHGLAGRDGTVSVSAERDENIVTVAVIDDGVGLSDGGSRGPGDGLGTQIVQTMVESDLGGEIEWAAGEDGGTRVTFTARLAGAPARGPRLGTTPPRPGK